jgi:hypothetical protein
MRHGFDVGKIYYEGHWKGWALEIETFLGPEMATRDLATLIKRKQHFPHIRKFKWDRVQSHI